MFSWRPSHRLGGLADTTLSFLWAFDVQPNKGRMGSDLISLNKLANIVRPSFDVVLNILLEYWKSVAPLLGYWIGNSSESYQSFLITLWRFIIWLITLLGVVPSPLLFTLSMFYYFGILSLLTQFLHVIVLSLWFLLLFFWIPGISCFQLVFDSIL